MRSGLQEQTKMVDAIASHFGNPESMKELRVVVLIQTKVAGWYGGYLGCRKLQGKCGVAFSCDREEE